MFGSWVQDGVLGKVLPSQALSAPQLLCSEIVVSQDRVTMTRLTDTLQSLGFEGEIALGGRWVTIHSEQTLVYVVEATWGNGYYTWCADPRARTVEFYHDPVEAIQASLRRAAQLRTPACHN
jgi:hypothetical protein